MLNFGEVAHIFSITVSPKKTKNDILISWQLVDATSRKLRTPFPVKFMRILIHCDIQSLPRLVFSHRGFSQTTKGPPVSCFTFEPGACRRIRGCGRTTPGNTSGAQPKEAVNEPWMMFFFKIPLKEYSNLSIYPEKNTKTKLNMTWREFGRKKTSCRCKFLSCTLGRDVIPPAKKNTFLAGWSQRRLRVFMLCKWGITPAKRT